eukprot:CAMPEP_0173377496 /NCGR_PEP_ID=MMETSP1356-20130122/739_1 /TAXON_ID=77927 ORGANISM="Hemiselmis virescens, Strain PCC157" /NCGR_SAMPLE_ID=MMETSP1356 /ASSEMBLY_ACC=CAM_ASM_000847 /LENGTH=58 /DNA_ID=CAMNT_0014330263 /DNA_START=39 /DNA_END=215 /DNA_ORIENTATION=-
MARCVGNGNHQCRGSGIKRVNSVLGSKSQKSTLKKKVSGRKGYGGKLRLSNIGKSLNK